MNILDRLLHSHCYEKPQFIERQAHVPRTVQISLAQSTVIGTVGMSMQKSLVHVRFFQTATGHQPVRAWLRSLPKEQRQAIGEAIGEVQIGWPVGMQLVRKLERALWEIRTNIPPNEIARVIFSIAETPQAIILLHGFVKKSQKTPQLELNTARKRLKERQT